MSPANTIDDSYADNAATELKPSNAGMPQPANQSHRYSLYVWLLVATLATLAVFQDRRWKPLEVFDSDPGGYYTYLPSLLLYQHVGRADSLYQLAEANRPSKVRNIGLQPLPNGNVITKYTLGVAAGELPWFMGAHLYASRHGDPANGFSQPYQQSIMLAGLVYGLLGLWIVRKLLLRYFIDGTTAWTLAGVGLGTNFLVYTSYEAAMAHSALFMWQAATLYCTARWYQSPTWRWAGGMGFFLGMAVLCRPPEILYVLVPLAWGLTSWDSLRERGTMWRAHAGHLLLAVGLGAAVVAVQLFFWHAASGQWLLDSYAGEQFDFAHPHLLEGLFSFRKGWLLYTPLAGLMLLGLGTALRQIPAAVAPTVLLLPVLLYVTFSWEAWWYGGGFSARALVSLYPLLALSLAALLAEAWHWQWPRKRLLQMVFLLCIALNLWQTWQFATGALWPDRTTGEQYKRNFFRPMPDTDR
ncbi:ArnT family glycosyltransferase [Hymenobacter negativus]|uniref:Glycosyltransferase family 39 protein n=1 Tax=Hymenobacter negativus TaxID=2795026 RepID=A0ABS3QAS0_9BACT|nr:glycosyltransferase family 39 protein [Hymenobacter negativus]MBO2008327.1 glycosyltransferase family 39 protein [Hymenobacter negativus]